VQPMPRIWDRVQTPSEAAAAADRHFPPGAGKPGPGSIARLPKSMMVVLANLSGFGNEVAQFRGGSFTREDLVPRPTP